MPLYCYDCLSCRQVFNVRHSYKQQGISCPACGSLEISKNLSEAIRIPKKNIYVQQKDGTMVKEAIEDGKQELENYKKERTNKVYQEK
tara:strand:+ start:69 stop:332 length:264 start_codon:yes stop_codon:yes gene_type:complete